MSFSAPRRTFTLFFPLLLPGTSSYTSWIEMRAAARPENRFKPRRLILTFPYRFAKFPNSFFPSHSLSFSATSRIPPPRDRERARPPPRERSEISLFAIRTVGQPAGRPALCKLRFIPQTANVFLPPSYPPSRSMRLEFCNEGRENRAMGAAGLSHGTPRSRIINRRAYTPSRDRSQLSSRVANDDS